MAVLTSEEMASTRASARAGTLRRGDTPTTTVAANFQFPQNGAAVVDALNRRFAADLASLTATDVEGNSSGSDVEGLKPGAQLATRLETDDLRCDWLERRLARIAVVQDRLRSFLSGMSGCGLVLPDERHKALPEATHCLGCQRAVE